MLFTDESSRHVYHTGSTLLQVVCQMLESEMTKCHLQLEFVDAEQKDKFWEAQLIIASDDFEDNEEKQACFKAAVLETNKRFTRYDGQPTAVIEHGNFGLLTVRVSEPQDLAALN